MFALIVQQAHTHPQQQKAPVMHVLQEKLVLLVLHRVPRVTQASTRKQQQHAHHVLVGHTLQAQGAAVARPATLAITQGQAEACLPQFVSRVQKAGSLGHLWRVHAQLVGLAST